MMKSIRNFAVAGVAAGVFALVPSMASAFHGNLITCQPGAFVPVTATVKPGLDCDSATHKIAVALTMDNCAANPAIGTIWDDWAAGKIGSKITSEAAASIKSVSIAVKAIMFGSCNFAGAPNSNAAAGAGTLKFLDIADKPVKGGGGSFYGTVVGDLASQSLAMRGLMTKGFGAGAKISILVGMDLPNPMNAEVLACNLGFVCPPPISPSTGLALITDANSQLRIDIQNNADCVANNNPYPCCTGAGVGSC